MYEPMLCRSEPTLPTGPGWVFEPKLDGFRVVVWTRKGQVSMRGRGGGALERSFPDVAQACLAALPQDTILDGELVVCDSDGASFDALLVRLSGGPPTRAATIMAFDILRLDGRDLRDRPFRERRALLERTIEGNESMHAMPQTDYVEIARAWLTDFASQGIEGVVCKRRTMRYLPGRREMSKVKVRRTTECVVGGYRGQDEPDVLLLGLHHNGGLRYVGQTVSLPSRERLRASSILRTATSSPFDGRPPGISRWEGFRFDDEEWVPVEADVVAEVAYTALSFGVFRHAAGGSFAGVLTERLTHASRNNFRRGKNGLRGRVRT